MADHGDLDGPRQRHVELGVAAAMAALGGIAILGSLQVGIGWATEGPQSGFFPFWIGLIIVAASAVNLVRAFAVSTGRRFARWSEIRQVLKVVWPMALYVAAVPWLGIYLSSAMLTIGFMRWVGRYGWGLCLLVGIGLQVIAYVTFERWFLVPLPKGPLEDLLGL